MGMSAGTVAVTYGVPKSYEWEAWTSTGHARGRAPTEREAKRDAADALKHLRSWAALL